MNNQNNSSIPPVRIDVLVAHSNVRGAAKHYHDRSLAPIPVPIGSKAPNITGWQNLKFSEYELDQRFNCPANIGILLGTKSRGLVDIDLDCIEAIKAAPFFLPSTLTFGRPSKLISHYLYVSPDLQTRKFQDTGTMLVEMRSDGCQTIFPPSVHPSRELIRFSAQDEIKSIDSAHLSNHVSHLAAAVLMARHWPDKGSRQDAALALSGALLSRGLHSECVTKVIQAIAVATDDEELAKRVETVSSTAKSLSERREVTGFTTLSLLLSGEGKKIIERFCEWLNLKVQFNSQTASLSIQWPTLKPLPSIEPEVPSLSEELLPAPFRPWLLDIAERLQVPLEYPTVALLVAVGTVIGRRCGIRPKKKDDWTVVPNLWGAIVGRPGVLKSPAITQALKPLQHLSQVARKEYEKMMAEVIATGNAIEAQMKGVEKLIAEKARKGQFDVDDLKKKLTELQEAAAQSRARETRYITSDGTQEKLADLLTENPNGLLVLRDELYGFLRSLEKPGYENARTFFLEAWSGLVENYRVDRIIRGSSVVPALRIALFGSIQPGRLRDFFADAMRGGGSDDGLIQRLQLLVYPPIPADWKLVDRLPDPDQKDRAYKIFEYLSKIDPMKVGAECNQYDTIPCIRFSNDAQFFFNEWLTKLEKRLRSGSISCAAFESHIGKYRSLLPALALCFHLVDWASGMEKIQISRESAQLAASWCDFLQLHAIKVYSGAMNQEIVSAHELAKKIKEGKLRDGMSVRDVYRRNWRGLDSNGAVDAGLCILSDRHWIRIQEVKGPIGAPSEKIRLHPDLVKQQ